MLASAKGSRMLFATERHETLLNIPWSETRARQAIQQIVDETERARASNGNWSLHPLDDEGDEPPTGCKSLYIGTAGVLWTLWYLQGKGAAAVTVDLAAGIQQASAAYLEEPDTGGVVPSYFLGEVGILLVSWMLTRSPATAERLHDSIKSNITNPTNEALWGAPGTMVAAWHMFEATADTRWRDLFLENADQLWQTWIFDPNARCYLWTQDLYGRVVQYLGAGHGFVGNAFPLLKGAQLLDADRRDELYERCVETLHATKRADGDGTVNWRPGTFEPRPGSAKMLMQWCHGAPGVVTSMADFPPQQSAEMDEMLLGAGHAVWRAGPLTKGYGLCHGTAGNGYAFLKLYRRTGDPIWLERARSFAMHAIAQRERMREEYSRGRYTLWTGDAGLAVYIWHCVQGLAELPTLDVVQ